MKKIISTMACVAIFIMLITNQTTVLAAVGSEGYAVYRDGVLNGLNWHTGIMYDRTRTYSSLPVIQASGSGYYVSYVRWSHTSLVSFMDGQNYIGSYVPKGGISSAGRDQVKYVANRLANDLISYKSMGQLAFNQNILGTKTYITYEDITHMRCDGVVEYCYEFNGYRVYGDDTKWNISKANINNYNHHDVALQINPQVQANSYMTKVSSVLP